MGALAREIATYQKHLAGLLDHANEYVLIKDNVILGFFPTRYLALEEGYKHFLDEGFLVRQILPVEPVHNVTRTVDPG